MQENVSNIPHWMQIALTALASGLSGIGIDRIYNTYLNRRKPTAEIHVTEATAAEIHVRAGSSAGEAIMRMMDRLDGAQVTIDRLREERDHWERKASELGLRILQAEADAAAAQLFVEQLNAAAKLTVCEHHPHGVKLKDYTPRQLRGEG